MQFQTSDSGKYFDQTIKATFEQKHLLSTIIFVLIYIVIHYSENRKSNLINLIYFTHKIN